MKKVNRKQMVFNVGTMSTSDWNELTEYADSVELNAYDSIKDAYKESRENDLY